MCDGERDFHAYDEVEPCRQTRDADGLGQPSAAGSVKGTTLREQVTKLMVVGSPPGG